MGLRKLVGGERTMGDVPTMPMAGAIAPMPVAPVDMPEVGKLAPRIVETMGEAPPVRELRGKPEIKGRIAVKKPAPR
jgi:hypothetical protein